MPLETEEDVEAAARSLRQKLGIDDQLQPDMVTVIIKLKDRGLISNYVRVPDDEMPEAEAYYDSAAKLLYLRESTFCASHAQYTFSQTERRRARYTIAHEVAHIALGHDGTRYRDKKDVVGSAKVGRQERDADRFAAAFLAPAHLA